MKPDITLIITNWNGAALLRECLPSVLAAVEFDSAHSYEVMVIDDCSTDDSLAVLEKEFPTVVTKCSTAAALAADTMGMSQTATKVNSTARIR